MSKNKIFDNFIEDEFNKEETFNIIYNKIKKKEDMKKKILNSFSMFILVIFVSTLGVNIYAKRNWNKEYGDYLNRQIVSSNSTTNELSVKNENEDYIYKDDLGIKIKSFEISEYLCSFDIQFNKAHSNEKYQAFEFGYAIFDENNNIYAVGERTKFNSGVFLDYEKKLCTELNLQYNPNKSLPEKICTGVALNTVTFEEDTNVMRLELKSSKSFPKSQKLYIRIFDIGYTLVDESFTGKTGLQINDTEDFELSNSEWQFEINIPNETYNREYKTFAVSQDIPNLTIEDISLSSEGFLKINIDTNLSTFDVLSIVSISNQNETIYPLHSLDDSNKITLIFYIGKENIDNNLFINVNSKDSIKLEKLKLTNIDTK